MNKSVASTGRVALGGSIKHGAQALTALALAMSSGLAAAQTVQVFGIVDVGVLTQSNSAAGGSQTQMATSGLRQSVWGIKGTDDLGNGNKAFFNLESHFDTNNGAIHGTGDAPGAGTILFRRQANVGLTGDWGTIILGRQYGPALLAHLGTEPRYFKEQFSNLYAWAYGQLFSTVGAPGGNRNTNNDVGIFFNNAIQYRNTFGPVTLGVLYSFGGVPGEASKNSIYALGATYNGPVVLSFSYEAMKDQGTGTETVKHTGLGFAVPFGEFTFKANGLDAKNNDKNGVEMSDVRALGAGVDWKWSPSNSATLAYYNNKDKLNSNDKTDNIVLSNDYSLSKRTTLYTQMAYVDAKSGATLQTSIVAAGIPKQGAKTTLVNVGINHTF
jgi:predicted porin